MSAASSPSTPPHVSHDIEVAPYDDLDASVVSFEATVEGETLRLEVEQSAEGSGVYLSRGGASGHYLHLSGDVWPRLRVIVELIAAAERDYPRLASRAEALVAATQEARRRA